MKKHRINYIIDILIFHVVLVHYFQTNNTTSSCQTKNNPAARITFCIPHKKKWRKFKNEIYSDIVFFATHRYTRHVSYFLLLFSTHNSSWSYKPHIIVEARRVFRTITYYIKISYNTALLKAFGIYLWCTTSNQRGPEEETEEIKYHHLTKKPHRHQNRNKMKGWDWDMKCVSSEATRAWDCKTQSSRFSFL